MMVKGLLSLIEHNRNVNEVSNVYQGVLWSLWSCEKYINTLNDERSKIIEEVFLEDFSDTPIPQENLDLPRSMESQRSSLGYHRF